MALFVSDDYAYDQWPDNSGASYGFQVPGAYVVDCTAWHGALGKLRQAALARQETRCACQSRS